ncbi:MAG: protein kinase [Planctomycetota bacterium]
MFTPDEEKFLVDYALREHLISKNDLNEARYTQSKAGKPLFSILRSRGTLSEENYAKLVDLSIDSYLYEILKNEERNLMEGTISRIAQTLVVSDMTQSARKQQSMKTPYSPVSPLIMTCERCKARYNVSKLAPGTKRHCRKCGALLTIPEMTSVPTPVSSDNLYFGDDDEDNQGDKFIRKEIAGCLIIEKIGEGGMGVVYLGKHLALDRKVAIKVLPPNLTNEFFKDRFLREARAAAKLEHPNVVQVFDAGEFAGSYYMVMQYVEGVTLRHLIKLKSQIELPLALRILTETARGLVAAHKMSIVHRDVKPENIMLSLTGEVKVADFGLAKEISVDSERSHAGILIGTPQYVAPEMFREETVDHRVDIYALGVTFYYMLAGRPPFVGKTPHKLMHAHLNLQPIPITEYDRTIPPLVVEILNKMLEKNKNKRYQSMNDLLADLEKISIPTE